MSFGLLFTIWYLIGLIGLALVVREKDNVNFDDIPFLMFAAFGGIISVFIGYIVILEPFKNFGDKILIKRRVKK